MLVKPEYEKIMQSIFKIVAPGQPLRIAIERIQEASLGGLLILSSIESIEKYVDGGFVLNTAFSPQKVYELAKMDGAVLISEDLKTIYGANVQLQPDKEIQTDESGTRHRTADRIAKLTNKLVITISERRKRITVFKGDFKYILDLVGDLLTKASQAIMSLEKYAISVNKYMEDLKLSEFENTVILEEVLNGLRYFYLMFIMDKEVNQYIMEIGNEGRFIELKHQERMANKRNTFNNFVKDYTLKISKSPEKIFDELMKLEKDEIREDAKIAKILGYDLKQTLLDETLESKGYRILNSANKLTKKDVENIGYDEIYSIKGMGKFKTERVLRMKEKFENKY